MHSLNPPGFSMLLKINWQAALLRLDLANRFIALRNARPRSWRSLSGLLVAAGLIQAIAEFVPIVAGLIWPFLVYGCSCAFRPDQHDATGSMTQLSGVALTEIRKKPTIAVALALYGVLGVVLSMALTDALRQYPLFVAWIPSSVMALFPYTFAQGVAMLFVASCALRLVVGGDDEFAILGYAMREFVRSPLSCLLIVLMQSAIWTYAAVQVTASTGWPALATIIGHFPYALIVLAWACGGVASQARQVQTVSA